ncbi:MAG: hypothetical protein R3F02_06195 [Thiolinea sp.]
MKINHSDVQAELKRIVGSRCFRSRKTLCKFLRYIVSETLEGRQQDITQYTIAINALGRAAGFSAGETPLVRVQAGRLRTRLQEYYEAEGRFNPVRITLPLGSYVPLFEQQLPAIPPPPALSGEETAVSQSRGPDIVCIPRNFVADETIGWPFITRLTRDYTTLLARFSFLQVIFIDENRCRQTDEVATVCSKHGADFAVFFDLHADAEGFSLQCSMLHAGKSQPVWSQGFHLGESYPDASILDPVFKRIAHDTVAYDPGLAHGLWAQQMLDSGKPPASRYQVLVTVRQYIREPTPQNFRASFRACEQRLEKFPHDTLALLVYANLCFTEYGVKFNIVDAPGSSIIHAADALLQLDPGNPYTYIYHAIACFLEEEHEQCRLALEQARAFNPYDSYLDMQVALIHLGLGDWQKGAELIQSTIDISPFYPDWYHIPLSICFYREGHYLAAMHEANKVKLKHLWTPLLRTALYQCNQKLGLGKQEYRQMVNQYPDVFQISHKIAQDIPHKSGQVLKKLWSHIPFHS